MAKSNAKKKDDEFELESEDKKALDENAITDAKIKQFAKNLNAAAARKEAPQSEYGQLFKQFQEDGGHNTAMKWTLKLQGMEEIQKQELIRNFIRYCKVLNVFEQQDFFDDVLKKAA